MGNNASQHSETEQQWTHSFPRTPQKFSQNLKVLPELNASIQPKLRHTNNGEILFNGGTISGRHQQHNLSLPRKDGPSPKVSIKFAFSFTQSRLSEKSNII